MSETLETHWGIRMSESLYDFPDEDFDEAFTRARKDVGRINIAIFGKSGVGKSTLLNTVFGREIAKTGTGRPVTPGSCLYVTDSGILGIYDNRGLEIGDDSEQILTDLKSAVDKNRHLDESLHIHAAWYCVHGRGGRFEPAEADFVAAVARMGIPVIVVLTQTAHRNGTSHPDSVKLLTHIEELQLPIASGRPVAVCALPDPTKGHEQFGLTDLLDLTFEVAPAGVAAALDAAQAIDLDRKHNRCLAIVSAASSAAAAAALSPVPGSDSAMIVPIQGGMMGAIAVLYGVDTSTTVIAGAVSTTLATQLGRMAAGWALKVIPGIGTAVGAAVNATVASGFTFAMGLAWGRVCERMVRGELAHNDSAAVKEAFMAEFKKRFAKTEKDVKAELPQAPVAERNDGEATPSGT